jgi:hypothetical protein
MLPCKIVIGLDIEYRKKESRRATISVWRTHVVNTTAGDELRVIQEVADDVCLGLRPLCLCSNILHKLSAMTEVTIPITFRDICTILDLAKL